MDTAQIREILPHMRALKRGILDRRVCVGNSHKAAKTGCSCDFLFYQANEKGARPLVVVLHGGGFALGDARTCDSMCERIRDAFCVNVASVDYRLAPENPFPAALDDAKSVLAYLVGNGCEFRIDPDQIYLLGFSAGANLALATCIALQDARPNGCALPKPAGLIVHYPFLDALAEPDPDGRPEDVPYEFMVAFNEFYTAGGDASNPLISPLYATDEELAQLPELFAYPVDGDPLAPSCAALCRRMRALGLSVHERVIDGQYHGYIEDAVDLPSYLASTMPATISMRSHNFFEIGWRTLFASLADCLGVPEPRIVIPREGTGDLEAIYASVRGEDA